MNKLPEVICPACGNDPCRCGTDGSGLERKEQREPALIWADMLEAFATTVIKYEHYHPVLWVLGVAAMDAAKAARESEDELP